MKKRDSQVNNKDIGEVCVNCKYWDVSEVAHWGKCKRNAPKPLICSADANSKEWESYRYVKWPDTGETDRCGEFKPKS
ncbi:MAG: hypothetical protein KAS32_07720 [Candidatus Peribacteraceae bacterium]|nr:hypothetical protein [Candidatus Peribacteraceae bacterium]